jgi:glycosyltransferase involved in cell wall biosynthesis
MNTDEPLVVIGVPVYNGEKYIIDALESIKIQTYKNFKCHIVNNASTDRTEQLVQEFVTSDPRFKLHSYNEFIDITGNWNRTVQYIDEETKYFKVVQADDVIFPDSLNCHVTLMEKYPGAGLASSYRMIGDRPKGYGLDYFKGNCWNGKEMLLKHLKNEASVIGSNTQNFYRVEHLKKLPFYPEIFLRDDLHFDNRLAYELMLISDLVFSFSITSLTRRQPDSATVTTGKKLNTLIHGRETRLNRFREHFPELNKNYAILRRRYAYFLLINYLMFNKKCIQWHRQNLKRKIKFSEYVAGIFCENIFSRLLFRISKRYFPTGN